MNFFKSELKRSLLSFSFLLIIVITLIVLFISIKDEYLHGEQFGTLYLFNLSRSGAISLLVPILATIPFAGSFSEERNSGFLPFLFIRLKKKKYIISKLVSVGLSGALSLTIPYLLFFTWLCINFPIKPLVNPLPGPFGELAQSSPFVYILFSLIMIFVFGFIYALIGLAASTLFKQTLFAYILPFVLYLLPAFFLTFFNLAFLEPATTWDSTQNSLSTIWTISGQLLLLGLGSVIIFYFKINRMRFPNE